MQQGGLGGDALGEPFWSAKTLAESPWRRTVVGMLGEAGTPGSTAGDMAMKLGLLDRSGLYDDEGNEMPGLMEAKKRSMASWQAAMGGEAGFMENLTPEQIRDFQIIMSTDPALQQISDKALGQTLGQFSPFINRGALAGQGTFERLATQIQMGGDPYGAMQSFGTLGNISPVDYGAMSEMVDAISRLDGEDMAKVKTVGQMFRAISQPMALATGTQGYRFTPGTAETISPMGVIPGTPDQLAIDRNVLELARSPGGMSMYQRALTRWQARAAWDPSFNADEGPRPIDFGRGRYDIRTAEGRQAMMEGIRQEGMLSRQDQIDEGMYFAGPAGRGLLLGQTRLQAQTMENQTAQRWALAPGTLRQQRAGAMISMAMAGPMAQYSAGTQLAGMQANIPYQRALALYQGQEQAPWQAFMGGVQSQFGLTGNWDQSVENMAGIANLGVSPNVGRQLAGMPYGLQLAEAFGGGTQGAARAVLLRQGRGMTGLAFGQQEAWDLSGDARAITRRREDAMMGLSMRGMQLREDRFEPRWDERWDQFNLQRRQQVQGFGFRREGLTSTERGAQAGQDLSMEGLGLQLRGLNLGMTQFNERFGMQAGWAQTQFENQMADMQRSRDQSLQMRAFTQADMPLQRRQFDISQLRAQQRIQFQEADIGRQRGYQLADVSFQQAQTARQFGWQMEDIDESIRFSTGRGRRRLLRQRGRLVESRNIQTGREDEMEARRETEWEIQDERFQISKERQEELMAIDKNMFDRREERIRTQWDFEDKNFEIRQDRMQQARDHQVAMMDMQKRHFEDQHALQKDQYKLQQDRAELQQRNINAQIEQLDIQKQFADDAHGLAVERMEAEKAHAKEQLQLQKEQVAANAAGREELRKIADQIREIEHDRAEMQGMWAAMSAGVDPSAYADQMFGKDVFLSGISDFGENASVFVGERMNKEQEKVMEVWKKHYQESSKWGVKAIDDLEGAQDKLTEILDLVALSIATFEQVEKRWSEMGVTGLSVISLLNAAIGGEGGGEGGGETNAGGREKFSGAGRSLKTTMLTVISEADQEWINFGDNVIETLTGDENSLQSAWTKLYTTIGYGEGMSGGLGVFATEWDAFFNGAGTGMIPLVKMLQDEKHLGGLKKQIDDITKALTGEDGLTKAINTVVSATQAAVDTLISKANSIATESGDGSGSGQLDSGYHGLVRRGDYLMKGGRKFALAGNGSEWLDVWPSESSYGRGGGGGNVASALNGMKVELVVDGNQMEGYLRTRERNNLYRESFR